MQTLIVWTTEEEEKVYLVELSDEDLSFLKQAHRQTVNVDDYSPALAALSFAVMSRYEKIEAHAAEHGIDPKWVARFEGKEFTGTNLPNNCAFILSGMAL